MVVVMEKPFKEGVSPTLLPRKGMRPKFLDRFSLSSSVTLMERTTQINGREINVNRWVPDGEPKAVVLVSHGLHEHGRRYHGVAEVLAREKYLVIAPDHYAHGLSEGTRGLIVDYKFLIEDFVTLCKNSHEEYPLLPFFIVSHSLGTMVSVMTIKELPFLKVCICSYPYIHCL